MEDRASKAPLGERVIQLRPRRRGFRMIISSSVWALAMRAIWHGAKWLWRAMVTGDNAPYVTRVTVFITLILVVGLAIWEYEIGDKVGGIPAMAARRDEEMASLRLRDDAQDQALVLRDVAIKASTDLIAQLSVEMHQLSLTTAKLEGKVNVLAQDTAVIHAEVFHRSWSAAPSAPALAPAPAPLPVPDRNKR